MYQYQHLIHILPLFTRMRVLLQQNSMSDEWNLSGTQWQPRVPLHPVLLAAACQSDLLTGHRSTGRMSMAQLYISQKDSYSSLLYIFHIVHVLKWTILTCSCLSYFCYFLREKFDIIYTEIVLLFIVNDQNYKEYVCIYAFVLSYH